MEPQFLSTLIGFALLVITAVGGAAAFRVGMQKAMSANLEFFRVANETMRDDITAQQAELLALSVKLEACDVERNSLSARVTEQDRLLHEMRGRQEVMTSEWMGKLLAAVGANGHPERITDG